MSEESKPNELIVQGQITTAVVHDVVDDLQLVAQSSDELAAAQAQMTNWFAAKIDIEERDRAELEQSMDIAMRNGWDVRPFERQLNRLQKRVEFYDKCRMACEAGYAIVPNMPAECFAIRTARKKPLRKESTWPHSSRNQQAEGLPAGQGEWRDSEPLQNSYTYLEETDGDPKTKRAFFAAAFPDEIEFPMSIAKPAVMNATATAMAKKVFDEMHVLPGRRRKGDPLVLGVIRNPKGRERDVSFMVGWYLDTATLV